MTRPTYEEATHNLAQALKPAIGVVVIILGLLLWALVAGALILRPKRPRQPQPPMESMLQTRLQNIGITTTEEAE